MFTCSFVSAVPLNKLADKAVKFNIAGGKTPTERLSMTELNCLCVSGSARPSSAAAPESLSSVRPGDAAALVG